MESEAPDIEKPVRPRLRELLPTGAARWISIGIACVLAVITFVHLGSDGNAALWALVQVILVALAAIDATHRRLPNVITVPTAWAALVLRLAFVHSAVIEILVAGAVAFAVFLVFSIATRGGIGMGDVKVAGMLGLLLGAPVIGALAVGVFAGGLWSVGLLVSRRAGLHTSIAYGPFLAFGGMVAILFSSPPALV